MTLTTFWHARHLEAPTYSVASKQPDGMEHLTLEFLVPKLYSGKPLFEDSKQFKTNYEAMLKRNSTDIVAWIESLKSDIVIACWCKEKPYKLTRCTRILVAILLKRIRPDLDVRLTRIQNPAWRV